MGTSLHPIHIYLGAKLFYLLSSRFAESMEPFYSTPGIHAWVVMCELELHIL